METETIRRFLADRFLFDADAAIEINESLIESGVLDSTGAMELVLFLEEQFSIEVADDELVPQNLDTIARIGTFVQQKLSHSSAGNKDRTEAADVHA